MLFAFDGKSPRAFLLRGLLYDLVAGPEDTETCKGMVLIHSVPASSWSTTRWAGDIGGEDATGEAKFGGVAAFKQTWPVE